MRKAAAKGSKSKLNTSLKEDEEKVKRNKELKKQYCGKPVSQPATIERDQIVTYIVRDFIVDPLMAELYRREIRDQMEKDAQVICR